MQQTHNGKLDKWGIFWSVACAIHCLAIPLAVVLAPALAIYLRHEMIHWVLFAIVTPVAFLALWKPRRVHRSNGPVILGSIGLGMLFVSLLVDELSGHSHTHEAIHGVSIITIVGSFFLIGAHLLNLKLHRQCCDVSHTPKQEHHHAYTHGCCGHDHDHIH